VLPLPLSKNQTKEEIMTQESLKAVFRLDQETGVYSSAGHNLAPQKATERAGELESAGKKVQTLDQPGRHRALSFKHCKACATAAKNLSQKRPGDVAPDESEGE
jgi:hypothetical protein